VKQVHGGRRNRSAAATEGRKLIELDVFLYVFRESPNCPSNIRYEKYDPEPKRNAETASMRSAIAYLLLWLCIFLTQAQEETCTPGDDTCIASPKPNRKLKATFQNLSPYRADVHFDDGRFGNYVATLETNGEKVTIDSFAGHRFFITRHGVREGLVDPSTDEQYFFTVKETNNVDDAVEFTLPSTAAPSKTKCKDRYPVCVHEAARGECTRNPGWMIVNCCKSCDEKEGYGKYLDSKVRCTRERLNATIPAWENGSLDALFTKWATEDKYKPYEPRVISSPNKVYNAQHEGPWIMVFDNFLDDYEINDLMKGANFGDGFQRSTDQGSVIAGSGEKEKKISTHRTSSNAWCRRECEELDGVKRVSDRIEDVSLTVLCHSTHHTLEVLGSLW
jgi:hypothetical protein